MKKPGVPKTSYVPKRESKPDELLYRWDAINRVIKYMTYERYLEIGVCGEDLEGNSQKGECFKRIKCAHKDGVDPYGAPANYHMTSDEFFDEGTGHAYEMDVIDEEIDNIYPKLWDLIFIDAEHHSAYLTRDLNNAFKHLEELGVVAVHDAYPNPEYFCDKHIIGGGRGIVWQTIAKFMEANPQLGIVTLSMDNGIAFIGNVISDRPSCTDYKGKDWIWLQKNMDAITNRISIEKFKEMFRPHNE